MKCPKCGAEMREKSGRYGRFLGCPNSTMQRSQGLGDKRQFDALEADKTESRAASHIPGDNQPRFSTKTTTIVPVEHLPP